MSDADRQHVHRQQDNGQDEHAANGGPDPSFRGLVHATVAAVKRRGGHCMRFLGHWLRPLGLVELCSLSERDPIKLRKTAGTEMPFIYEIDSPDVCPPAKRKNTWQSKRSIRAHNAVLQKAGRAHSRRTNERTFVSAGHLW